jgi:hypothetical protein
LSMILSKGLCFFFANVSAFRVRYGLPVYNTVSLMSFPELTGLKSLRPELGAGYLYDNKSTLQTMYSAL